LSSFNLFKLAPKMKLALICTLLALLALCCFAQLNVRHDVHASCPTNVARGSYGSVTGSGTIYFTNRERNRKSGSISIKICNSQGQCERKTDSFSVRGGGTYSKSLFIQMRKQYTRYGQQEVTVRVQVGGHRSTGIGRCAFTVY